MRVFPDTNVLFPVRLINLVMRSHAARIIEVVWSDELLAEFERVMVDKKGVDPEHAAGVAERIRRYSPDGRIPPALYNADVDTMTGRDVDDHVHAAAARVGADVLLTDNIDDFRQAEIEPCRLLSPAMLFAELARPFGSEFARLLIETSNELKSPVKTPHELLEDLAAIGLTEFAETVGKHFT